MLLKISEAGYLAAAGAAVGAAGAASMTSEHQQMPFISLIYVGPVIMSLGCFAVIFAFVVFCEARDHAIEFYLRSKLYASSTRGPRHSSLPFRRGVIEVILTATKRRAERAARSSLGSSLTAIVPTPSPGEVASAVERCGDTVDDNCFKIDCRPMLLPLTVGIDRTTDWLLSNEMHSENESSSCLDRSQPDIIQLKQLNFEQSPISRSSSKWLLSNGMLHTEFLHDMALASGPDEPKFDNVHLEHPGFGEDESSDWSLSNGMPRELQSPERDGEISTGNSNDVADSAQDEMSVNDMGWIEDWKPAEVVPLAMVDVPSDGNAVSQNVELEETSVTYTEQSQIAMHQSSSSSSTSSVRVISDIVGDNGMTTTLASKEDQEQTVDETVTHSSIGLPLDATDTVSENVELEGTSMTYAKQSLMALESLNSSSSSSSSLSSSVHIISQVVGDDGTTTKLESNDHERQTVDDSVANSSPGPPPDTADTVSKNVELESLCSSPSSSSSSVGIISEVVGNDGTTTALESKRDEDATMLKVAELEGTSIAYAEQSQMALVSLCSSSSSSPPPPSSSVHIICELVGDNELTTTLETKEDKGQRVEGTAANSSFGLPPNAAPNSPGSTASESPDIGDRVSPSAGSNDDSDGVQRTTTSGPLPSADSGAPSPTSTAVKRPGCKWKRGDGRREMRSHAGIHCPPPLPPPPTSPTSVAASGRSPRKHR